MKRIAIIGAGFTGLTAGIDLLEKGYKVTIFEKETLPGGLAIGFQKDGWEWSLEKHYHHIFQSDIDILNLSQKVGVTFEFSRPITSSYINNSLHQVDSPLSLLQFPHLPTSERLRMGAVLAYLKYAASWENLEPYTAHEWLTEKLGKRSYSLFWKPLLEKKFGRFYKQIALSWFWARIKARTSMLGYPQGGFQTLAEKCAEYFEKTGGEILYNSDVSGVLRNKGEILVSYTLNSNEYTEKFKNVVLTLPYFFVNKLVRDLPAGYRSLLTDFKGIGAANMVLELDAPFFSGGEYWVNINDTTMPFLALVEHTNFVSKEHYDNSHLLYVGNYLEPTYEQYAMTQEQLLDLYIPHLLKFNPDIKNIIKDISLFKVPFAQPIVTSNFSKKILPFETPISGIYVSNMQSVYPWDRGTNFAVQWGHKVAKHILNVSK